MGATVLASRGTVLTATVEQKDSLGPVTMEAVPELFDAFDLWRFEALLPGNTLPLGYEDGNVYRTYFLVQEEGQRPRWDFTSVWRFDAERAEDIWARVGR